MKQAPQLFVFDRRVSVALIMTLALQAATAIWWASAREAQDVYRDTRLQQVEARMMRQQDVLDTINERLARLEAREDEQAVMLHRIETHLLGQR